MHIHRRGLNDECPRYLGGHRERVSAADFEYMVFRHCSKWRLGYSGNVDSAFAVGKIGFKGWGL